MTILFWLLVLVFFPVIVLALWTVCMIISFAGITGLMILGAIMDGVTRWRY